MSLALLEDRVEPVIAGFHPLNLQWFEGRHQGGDAVWVLEGIDDPPVHHVLLRLMGQLGLGKEELHGSTS